MKKRAKKPKKITVRQWLESLEACGPAIDELGSLSLDELKRRWDAGEIRSHWADWLLSELFYTFRLLPYYYAWRWDVKKNISEAYCDDLCPRRLWYTQIHSSWLDDLLPEGLK